MFVCVFVFVCIYLFISEAYDVLNIVFQQSQKRFAQYSPTDSDLMDPFIKGKSGLVVTL